MLEMWILLERLLGKHERLKIMGITWSAAEALQWAEEHAEDAFLSRQDLEVRLVPTTKAKRWPRIFDLVNADTGALLQPKYIEIHRIDVTDAFAELMPDEVQAEIRELWNEADYFDAILAEGGVPQNRPAPTVLLPTVLEANARFGGQLQRETRDTIEDVRHTMLDPIMEALGGAEEMLNSRFRATGGRLSVASIYAALFQLEVHKRRLLREMSQTIQNNAGPAVTQVLEAVTEIVQQDVDRFEEGGEGAEPEPEPVDE
jgi:hypothetical protein